MRVAIFLLGIVLIFSCSAAAQRPAGVGSDGGYLSAGEHSENRWQFTLGYQYNRDNLLGSPFNTHGLNISAARYFGRWFGVEGQIGTGFLGNTGQTSTPPNLGVKSVFLAGGPKLAWRTRSRYEPWGHVLVGMEHYRFTQTAGLLGNNTSLAGAAGGGLDVYVMPHVAIRAEADAVGTRFFSTYQRSFQIVGGVVFGF